MKNKLIAFTLLFLLITTSYTQTDVKALLQSGTAKVQRNQLDSALADFNKAVNLSPGVQTYFYRGRVYNMKNEFKKAIDDFDQAIKLKPGFAEAYTHRATSKMSLELYEEALKDCNKAIELDSTKGDYYHLRAAAKAMLGDDVGSCEDMKMAIKLGNTWGEMNIKNACKD